MPNRNLVISLGKLLAAVAWADGELSNEELNCLKDAVFALPEVTTREWKEIEMYLATPVKPEERDTLIQEVLNHVWTPGDRETVRTTLRHLVECDDDVSPEEEALLAEVDRALEQQGGFLNPLRNLLRDVISRRERHVGTSGRRGAVEGARAPGREDDYDDYMRNRVYYLLQTEKEKQNLDLGVNEEQERKLSLAAGLMARIAHIEEGAEKGEKAAIERVLRDKWDLLPDAARVVTEIAVSRDVRDLDLYRLARTYYERSDRPERKRFLEILFQVANAAGKTSYDEIEEIRSIAKTLKLTHEDFIEAKLTIPREDRGGF